MKTGDILYGFRINSEKYIPEVSGRMYMMEHVRSGAALAFLKRDDDNKTFAVSFTTPPTDDTGVFHIIEHSVLCGSRKFPVKEPFVELLKGSLNTFLNAMTYEDRTVYPVASRCDKDFHNLTDVYLDAVFHPLMLENPNVFYQEGWHYEYSGDEDSLSYNGVVYNEMNGAYSSPDELSGIELRRALFGGSCYEYESGGHPDAIPTLTYEDFKRAHETYYHPSNAKIFLDGNVDLDDILPLIDSYLSEYGKKEINIEFSRHVPVLRDNIEIKYEAESEDTDGKVKIAVGCVCSDIRDRIETSALRLLPDVLTSTNESPLKKKMVESGLCADIGISVSSTDVATLYIDLHGVREENVSAALAQLDSAIRDIAAEGIDKRRIRATLNNSEFKMREHDYGSTPRGVVFALSVYSVWNYGIDPSVAIEYEQTLAELRSLIDGDYYDSLLLRATVDNQHRATVVMIPDKSLAEEKAGRLRAELRAARERMTDEELCAVIARAEALTEWQNTPDTPENLDTLPALQLSDLNVQTKHVDTERYEKDGAEILLHDLDTAGITYLFAIFRADMLSPEEIYLASLLTSALRNLPTENYTAAELESEIKSELGALSFNHTSVKYTKDGTGHFAVLINASVLDSSTDKLLEIIREIIMTTDYSDVSVVGKLLAQSKVDMEENFASDAIGYALTRAAAAVSADVIHSEYTIGYSAYRLTAEYCDTFEEKKEQLAEKLSDLAKRIFKREGAVFAVTGKNGREFADALVDLIPGGEPEAEYLHSPLTERRVGIAIPSRVGYAVSSNRSEEAKALYPKLLVARSMLSYDYLWSNIRVKGGAYGAGFTAGRDGSVSFYSYRDPSPSASLATYASAGDYLREICDEGVDLVRFIIGAIGEYDLLTTPRSLAAIATRNYLSGWTEEDEAALYRDMLDTSYDDLRRAADMLDDLMRDPAVAVAAEKSMLDDPELALTAHLTV